MYSPLFQMVPLQNILGYYVYKNGREHLTVWFSTMLSVWSHVGDVWLIRQGIISLEQFWS